MSCQKASNVVLDDLLKAFVYGFEYRFSDSGNFIAICILISKEACNAGGKWFMVYRTQ